MALYRFLFAPVLLAIAVVSGSAPSDRKDAQPPAPAPVAAPAPATSPAPSMPAALERAGAARPFRAR